MSKIDQKNGSPKLQSDQIFRTGNARAYGLIELLKVYRYYLGDGSDDLTKEQETRALDLAVEIEWALKVHIDSGRQFDKLMDFWKGRSP